MAKLAIPSPTELSILKTLWQQTPLSAKEIHTEVEDQLQWSFSSTRKTLDRMVEKQLLGTKQVHGVRVFSPKQNKLQTLAIFAFDFARRIVEIDGPLPASMFVDSKLLNKSELKELNKIISELEAGKDE